MANNDVYNPWYGKQNNQVLCPVPDCGHTGSFISKVHCRLNHGMEREEIEELHGLPKQLGKGWSFSDNEKNTRDQ